MKLGMQVGLVPGHIVLDGGPIPLPQRGGALQFSAHICCDQMRLGEEKRKKKEEEEEQTTGCKYNGLPYSIGRP